MTDARVLLLPPIRLRAGVVGAVDGAAVPAAAGAPPGWARGGAWVEMARTGNAYAHFAWDADSPSARHMEFTADIFAQIVQAHEVVISEGWFDGGPPVDVNHARASGYVDPDATARRASVRLLEVRPNESGHSLWGWWWFTQLGVDDARSGRFTDVSIEVWPAELARHRTKDEPLGLWLLDGATLCCDPFLIGMEPASPIDLSDLRFPDLDDPAAAYLPAGYAASIRGNRLQGASVPVVLSARPLLETAPMARSALLLTALAAAGLPPDIEDADIAGELMSLRTGKQSAEAEVVKLTSKLDGLTAERDTIKADLGKVQADRDALHAERFEALKLSFVAEGRCTPHQANGDADGDKPSVLARVLDGVDGTWADKVAHAKEVFAAGRVQQVAAPAAPEVKGAPAGPLTREAVEQEIAAKAKELASLNNRAAPVAIDYREASRIVLSSSPAKADIVA